MKKIIDTFSAHTTWIVLVMAGFVKGLIKGLIKDMIISTCSDYLKDQFRGQTGMKEELQRLLENQSKIQAVVDYASSQKQITEEYPDLNKWLCQLRDATNDVVELLPNLKRLEEAVQKVDKVSAAVTTFLPLLDSAKQEQKEQEVDFYKTRETGSLPRNDLIGRHWSTVLKSNLLCQNSSILRPSYMVLPKHLRNCFAFGCMFQQDHTYDKDDLVRKWIVLGFIQPSQGMIMEDIGRRYFDDMVNRSFFNKVGDGYKIHDLMHELASKIFREECGKLSETIRHLPVQISESIHPLSVYLLKNDHMGRRKVKEFVMQWVRKPSNEPWTTLLRNISLGKTTLLIICLSLLAFIFFYLFDNLSEKKAHHELPT
ncbi:hypothetical protein M5K25_009823 [Dendrobium thyrsiflorum]|uniref:Uncharacterized protein n=1 Tax=Dendrobium thyrsiflorum TaxID=117978 RepID=A0ABD0VDW4_DENTH